MTPNSPWLAGSFVLAAAASGFFFTACDAGQRSTGQDTASSTDGDTDVDTDADTDADTDEAAACADCTAPLCVARVSGYVLFENGTPVVDQWVQINIINSCYIVTKDSAGYFLWEDRNTLDNGLRCIGVDFSEDWPITIVLPDPDPGYATYSVAYTPTQAQVSDQGSHDFHFETGIHYLYELPPSGAEYTPAGGASVNLAGLSFQVPPGALGDQNATIKVLDGLTLGSIPPFVGNPYLPGAVDDLDGLFFISPYWWKVDAPGVELRMVAPGDWTDTDSGATYLLGDYCADQDPLPLQATCPCGGADVPLGELHQCCTASYDNGEVVFDPITRFGWIGVKKN